MNKTRRLNIKTAEEIKTKFAELFVGNQIQFTPNQQKAVEKEKKIIMRFLKENNWLSLEDEKNAEGVVDSYLKVYGGSV